MPNPLRDFLFGTQQTPRRALVDALTPRRTFADVVVPEATRRQLNYALVQIKKSDLIFNQWGLGERHSSGTGLAFNFAGPPGTGKTICAEAIAHDIGKRLLVVRYAEMESLWAGETSKNVSAVFRAAQEADAVLFFDEADAIATRRFGSVTQGYQREANAVVNVLLKELEEFDGVTIFATNLASNFDPAFERRIRTHILFEMPDAPAREKIWQVQLHARKTPLAADVNFGELAEKYAVSGGEIKNAVLKAAQMASAEPGPDSEKQIAQRHFIAGIEEVMASKKVMDQSLIEGDGSNRAAHDAQLMAGMNTAFEQLAHNDRMMGEDLSAVIEKSKALEAQMASLPEFLNRVVSEQNAARDELAARTEELSRSSDDRWLQTRETLSRSEEKLENALEQVRLALTLAGLALLAGLGALLVAVAVAARG